MVNLLVIEDNTIRAMLQDPMMLALLPCLSTPKQKLNDIAKGGRSCNRCQTEKRRIANAAMRAARDCIKNTRGKTLTELKKLLNAKQIRLIARNSANQKVQVTL